MDQVSSFYDDDVFYDHNMHRNRKLILNWGRDEHAFLFLKYNFREAPLS